jgi:hypothetical protein
MASGVDRPNARYNATQLHIAPNSTTMPKNPTPAGRKARRNRDRHHPPGAQPLVESR